MSFCAFIGDSIALGLALVAGPCDKAAHVGLSTPAIIQQVPAQSYRYAFLSAGSNDVVQPALRRNLRRNLLRLRCKVQAEKVVWLLPANPYAASAVNLVAAEFGDATASIGPTVDGVHPRSYAALWRSIQRRGL